MGSHFKILIVLQLVLGLLMELQNFLQEIAVDFIEFVAIFHVIQDSPRLRLNLVNVHIVSTGNRL